MEQIRITVAVATVLRVFVDDPGAPRHGYELMQLTGYPSGKLYQILARLQAAGWLTKETELVDTAQVGRPARRLYRIESAAVEPARQELAALSAQLNPGSAGPGRMRPAGGLA
jgi:PadR family transcriptional regulator PadR